MLSVRLTLYMYACMYVFMDCWMYFMYVLGQVQQVNLPPLHIISLEEANSSQPYIHPHPGQVTRPVGHAAGPYTDDREAT